MQLSAATVGERYGDDSGWARRVSIDLTQQSLQIDIGGSHLNALSEDLDWLIAALTAVRDAVTADDSE